MFKSPYMTQYTREQLAGKRAPQRNMENLKAKGKPARKAAWLKSQEAAKKQ